MAESKKATVVVDDTRAYLEGVAKNLADRIWGPVGPAWGTTMHDLEDLVVQLREVVSERLLRLALERQAAAAGDRPKAFRACPGCGGATTPQPAEPRLVHTRGGEAEWQEPREYCRKCRQAFFPSIQEFGH
jgi:hypothetical protein